MSHARTAIGMSVFALLCVPGVSGGQATEELTAEQALIRAMTLCPEPNNPIVNGVRALGGNLIANVRIAHRGPGVFPLIVEADVIGSPRTLDPDAAAPDSIKGSIRVEMGYRRTETGKGAQFYCRLKTTPAH